MPLYNASRSTYRGVFLDAGELARKAVDVASDLQASDILMLDLRPLNTFADYFVFMSAETSRQINAIEEDLHLKLKEAGTAPHHVEGSSDSGWVLMDYGDVVIHIFHQHVRDYYRLEHLWSNAREVVRIQ